MLLRQVDCFQLHMTSLLLIIQQMRNLALKNLILKLLIPILLNKKKKLRLKQ